MLERAYLVVGEGVYLRHAGGGVWLVGAERSAVVSISRAADGDGAWESKFRQLGAPIGDSPSCCPRLR